MGEQLKRIMEERKARRRARREARAAPYSTSWSLKSSDTTEDMEEREETNVVDRNGDNSTVKMQVGTASTSSSGTKNQAGGSTNSNGQNNPASQTGAGGNPSDIFNPELEPVTA